MDFSDYFDKSGYGRKEFEINWKNGKQDGLERWSYESGQKYYEANWSNGVLTNTE